MLWVLSCWCLCFWTVFCSCYMLESYLFLFGLLFDCLHEDTDYHLSVWDADLQKNRKVFIQLWEDMLILRPEKKPFELLLRLHYTCIFKLRLTVLLLLFRLRGVLLLPAGSAQGVAVLLPQALMCLLILTFSCGCSVSCLLLLPSHVTCRGELFSCGQSYLWAVATALLQHHFLIVFWKFGIFVCCSNKHVLHAIVIKMSILKLM